MRPLLSRCALGAAALLAVSLVAPAAQATDVEEARTEVQQLGREVEVAAEAYNEVRVQLQAQQDRVEATQARVTGQAEVIESMTTELGALAVETFKRGGVDPQLAAILGNPGDYASSTSALTLMAERRSVSLTDLKGAQTELVRLEADAAAELDEVQAMEADLAERKADIEARLAGAEDVLAAAEAEAARREAARIEAARVQAEQEAARQAAREAASQQASRSRTAGSGEAPSAGAPAAPAPSSSSRAGRSAPAPAAAAAPAVQASAGSMNCGGVSVDVPTDRVATVLSYACSQLGKPYKWGAAGPNSFDCSGFTMAAWSQVGVGLPHSSRSQAGVGTSVSQSQLRAGDLVFSFSPISHVGIYLGGGKMIAAPSAGDVVKIQSLQYLPFVAGTRL